MILAILQARMSSRRLPGKVLMDLHGSPMIMRQIRRIQQSQQINKLVVATSSEASDQPLIDVCTANNVSWFAGDLHDVLKRFYDCATQFKPEQVVRLTADCPLADPVIIDEVIEHHLERGNDYTTNAFPHTFPDGLDVEVIRFSALEQTHKQAVSAYDREHVTTYIRDHSERFTISSVCCEADLSRQRWTVDYPEDLMLIRRVFEQLLPQGEHFGYQQVLALLANEPELVKLNQRYVSGE